MFRFIKNIFFGLLTSLVVNATSHTKCISLSNQKYEIQSTLIKKIITIFFDKSIYLWLILESHCFHGHA